MFYPLNPFGSVLSWQQFLVDQRSDREAKLQQTLIDSDGQENVARILPRITCIGAATRAFLAWNRHLTALSDIPVVRTQELALLAQWLRAFKITERELVHALHVPFGDWRRQGSFRDELGTLAASSQVVYGEIQMIGALPRTWCVPITKQLCSQLMDVHHRHHPQPQME